LTVGGFTENFPPSLISPLPDRPPFQHDPVLLKVAPIALQLELLQLQCDRSKLQLNPLQLQLEPIALQLDLSLLQLEPIQMQPKPPFKKSPSPVASKVYDSV
jgi:hypothetical protein